MVIHGFAFLLLYLPSYMQMIIYQSSMFFFLVSTVKMIIFQSFQSFTGIQGCVFLFCKAFSVLYANDHFQSWIKMIIFHSWSFYLCCSIPGCKLSFSSHFLFSYASKFLSVLGTNDHLPFIEDHFHSWVQMVIYLVMVILILPLQSWM